jgi:uncharacterized protein
VADVTRVANLLVVLLLAALLQAVPVHAEGEIPRNEGWVTDLGGFLTPQQETSLETLMESYKRGSGIEIALLTVPDLGGRPIERYALEVARAWGIGQKERHNGALLVVARAEHKIRIEVGRGLEGNITDGIAGRIIRGVITPQFKQGHYYEGLRDGIEAMQAAAGGDYAQIPQERVRRSSRSGGLIGFLPLLFILFIVTRILHGGGRRGGRGGGLLTGMLIGSMLGGGGRSSGGGFGGGGGGFGGFGGGGGFSGGGASGGW